MPRSNRMKLPSQVRRGGCAQKEKSRSFLGRAQTGMSGANVSPIGRNKEEWFLSRTAITGGFRPRNHPGAADKTSPRHPPNLGGEFHSDASRHSGNLIAPAGGSFACTLSTC